VGRSGRGGDGFEASDARGFSVAVLPLVRGRTNWMVSEGRGKMGTKYWGGDDTKDGFGRFSQLASLPAARSEPPLDIQGIRPKIYIALVRNWKKRVVVVEQS
jgi:hypothetical protein